MTKTNQKQRTWDQDHVPLKNCVVLDFYNVEMESVGLNIMGLQKENLAMLTCASVNLTKTEFVKTKLWFFWGKGFCSYF